MRFAVLGSLAVTDEGRSLPLRGATTRRLLAALLVYVNHAVPDQMLAEWVWGDLDDGWKNRLQTAVSRLNRTLSGPDGPPRIVHEGASYRLIVGTDEYDVLVFGRLHRAAAEALARGDSTNAAGWAEAALAEWRGRAFGEMADERFTHQKARTLEAHRLATQQVRIEALLQLGERLEEVVAEAEVLVASEPGNERLRALLMKALYFSGRPGDALNVYHDYRTELRERTGRDPGSELRALEQAILGHDLSLDGTEPATEPTAAPDDRPAGPQTFLFSGLGNGPGGTSRTPDTTTRRALEVEVRMAIGAHSGRVFSLPGNDPCAVFERPLDAVLAARDAAVALRQMAAETGRGVRVRLAVHTGEAEPRGQSFAGAAIMRVARMRDAAHAGQVLVSAATRELVTDDLPPDVALGDIGAWQFDGFPHPERLYQLTHDELPREFPPLRAGLQHTGRLPRYTTAFVGREQEVTETAAKLEQHPLVTITGDGGIGKTRLALEVAQRATIARYPDGVWYCDVSSADDAETLVERVAVARGLVLNTDRNPVTTPNGDRYATMDGNLWRELVRSLESARLLFVLDGCERLREAVAELVADVLASGSEARFLVTSRARLGVSAEQVVKLDPLPVPEPADPEPEAAAAVQLLRAAALRAGAVVAAADRHLVELARRLEGLPLAIELAAPRLAAITPAMLVERLDHSFVTFTGPPGAPLHHRTLRATFDWSFELLTEAARRLLAALSLFRSTWTLDTAEAVAPAVDVAPEQVVDVMAELVDQSLVRVDMPAGGTARYTMLDTIRTYAAERLEQVGRYDAVADLHATHFLDLAERARQHRRGPDEPAWVAKLLAEFDDLRAAYRRFLDSGRPREALRLVVALGDELHMRERLEIERWAVEVAAVPAVANDPLRAEALGLAAIASLYKGRLHEAHERALAALNVQAAIGAPPSWTAHNALAYLTAAGVRDGRRRDHIEAMNAISDATGDPFPRAMGLWNRCLVARFQGDAERCEAAARPLRDLGDHHDNPSIRSMGLLGLGVAAVLRQDVDTARGLLHQARGAADAAHATLIVNMTVRALADLDARTGDRTAALAALRQVAESSERSGNVSEQLQTVMSMVEHLVALGELVPAAKALGALSRTPIAATVSYSAMNALIAERLDVTERLEAQGAGAGMQLDEIADEVIEVVDRLAGADAAVDDEAAAEDSEEPGGEETPQ